MTSGSLGVSVVIPLYNHSRYVAHSLASLFTQTQKPDEVVVIDDGSTDRSAEIMDEAGKIWPNIVFRRQANAGAHAAINAGIALAKHPLVAILNSDDVFAPTRLETAVSTLERDRSIDAVFTGVEFIDREGLAIENAWYERASANFMSTRAMSLSLMEANFAVSTSNFVFHRDLFEEIGGFANLRYVHDLDFLLRLLAHGRKVSYLPAKLLGYRTHGANTISEGAQKVKAELGLVLGFYREIYADSIGIELKSFEEMLYTHGLGPAVTVCRNYFSEHPTTSLIDSKIFSDLDVIEKLSKAAA